MDRGGVEAARHVLPGEDGDHTRHGRRALAPDAEDLRMRVRRAQHLEVQQPFHRDIHRVAGAAGHDRFAERIGQARPAGLAGHVGLGRCHAVDRVGDRAISRAAAEIAFQRVRQVGPLLGAQRGDGHDHAGGAEAALECLRIEERLLRRMQRAVLRETLDGRHLAPGGAKGGHQARVHGRAVQPDGAGAAIAGVATLLHAEAAALAQEGAQTLARLGCCGEPAMVHREAESAGGVVRLGRDRDVAHGRAPGASSARICSAKW